MKLIKLEIPIRKTPEFNLSGGIVKSQTCFPPDSQSRRSRLRRYGKRRQKRHSGGCNRQIEGRWRLRQTPTPNHSEA